MAVVPGYQHSDPFDSGYLKVGALHEIHYEQYGKRDGKPVIYLHGGPGGSTSKDNTSFFNPVVYHVVLFDQRGAGKSIPSAETQENTTHHLIDDMEALREHVGVSKWHMVFGGSWGSTLALAYAEKHPSMVGSLVLRGVFTGTRAELNLCFKGGISELFFPEEYAEWLQYLPAQERSDPLPAYHKLLNSENATVRLAAGKAWNRLEMKLGQLVAPPELYDKLEDEDWVRAHSKLEAHYFMNECFLSPGQLLKEENIQPIRHIPVQGRYDLLSVPKTAWSLHRLLPRSTLYWTVDAGHSAREPGTRRKLIEVCDMCTHLETC